MWQGVSIFSLAGSAASGGFRGAGVGVGVEEKDD